MRHMMTLALLLSGCDGGKIDVDSNEPADDSGVATDDSAEPCELVGAISIDSEPIEDFWWGGTLEPLWQVDTTVDSPPCQGFVASTTEAWLIAQIEPEGGGLQLTVDPGQVLSGRSSARVQLRDQDSAAVLAELEVSLSALVQPSNPSSKNVLVIGIDGMDGDEVSLASVPNIDRIKAGGVWSYRANTQLTGATNSGPGWTSILSGVEVSRHGVTSNGGYDGRDTDYPSFLQRARTELGLQSAVSIHWTDIFSILEGDAYDQEWRGSDEAVTDGMVGGLRSGLYQVHFVHLDDVDGAGHSYGFVATAPEYQAAMELADSQVGELFEAILDRPDIQDEDWMVIITSDHGGTVGGSHGCTDWDCQTIPFIAAGASIPYEELPDEDSSHLDVAPTVLDFLGLDVNQYTFDGVVQGVLRERDCEDGEDNDGDGATDCEDADCQGEAVCWECEPDDLGGAVGVAVAANVTPSEGMLSGTCGGGSGDELIYSWTAPADGTYSFDTMNEYRDTVLYVRDGGCDGEELACNDRPSSSARSVVAVPLTSGQEVTVVVDSNSGASGATQLAIYPFSDTCPDEALGAGAGSNTDSFNHRDVAYAGSCVPAVGVVWYSWTAPEAGTWTFSTSGSAFDTVIYVLDGCDGAELACNDDSDGYSAVTSATLGQGDAVVVGVGSFAGRSTSGTIQLAVSGP